MFVSYVTMLIDFIELFLNKFLFVLCFHSVTVMLVTKLRYIAYAGDFMMVTVLRCWWQKHYDGDFFILKAQTVPNICQQHRCRSFIHVEKILYL